MLLRPETRVSEMILLATRSEEVRVLVVGRQRRLLDLAVVVAEHDLHLVQPAVTGTEAELPWEERLEVCKGEAA